MIIFSYNLVRITQFSALRFMDAQFLMRLEFNLLSLMRTYFIALIFCIFSLMGLMQLVRSIFVCTHLRSN